MSIDSSLMNKTPCVPVGDPGCARGQDPIPLTSYTMTVYFLGSLSLVFMVSLWFARMMGLQ